MRKLHVSVGFFVAMAAAAAPAAEEAFDACLLFTQAEAEKALGTAASPEAVNPKAKRPKVVTTCTYHGFKDAKPVEARAQFKSARTEAEIQHAFDDAKLKLATKPLLIPGADASFWSARTGEMNVRKGRHWLVVTVGSPRPSEREMEPSRQLAQALAQKL